jgi:hypothetical protein
MADRSLLTLPLCHIIRTQANSDHSWHGGGRSGCVPAGITKQFLYQAVCCVKYVAIQSLDGGKSAILRSPTFDPVPRC